jgi:hypothetical protein
MKLGFLSIRLAQASLFDLRTVEQEWRTEKVGMLSFIEFDSTGYLEEKTFHFIRCKGNLTSTIGLSILRAIELMGQKPCRGHLRVIMLHLS